MKSRIWATYVVLALAAANVHGVVLPEAEAANGPADVFFLSNWTLGPQISSFHYEEPGLMEEDGVLYGVVFSATRFYRATESRDTLLRFEGSIAAGRVDYDGQLMDGTPYKADGNKDVLANARLLWGWVWHDDLYSNQVYTGLGYRYLGDDSSDDPAGYKRHSNYFYLPIGYERGWKLGDGWYLGLGAEFDLLLYGLQRSDLFGGSYEPIKNRQQFGSGYGLRGTIELRRRGETLDMSLAPFIQYWSVDDSDVDRGFYEPKNNSTQIGLDLIFYF